MTEIGRDEGQNGHPDHKEITIETLSAPPSLVLPAPLLSRMAACVVDSSLIAAIYVVLTVASSGYAGLSGIVPNFTAAAYVASFAFFYYFLLEGFLGATVGKMLLKLRVVSRDGDPCSFTASFTRNLLRFIDWLPIFYLIGGVAALTSKSRRRIGDRLASTTVVKAPEKDINPPPAPFLFH